jgi:tetraacyldisaccharide 4'-kinase
VHASRYLAGRVAESRFGCTVHVLDDGFQHIQLSRDIDLLVAPPEDFVRVNLLPFGSFREPLEAAAAADALLVPSSDLSDGTARQEISQRLNVPTAFSFTRTVDGPVTAAPVFAFAGIAKPQDFFSELERAGWQVVGHRGFRDHHIYTRQDLEALERSAREAGAGTLATTAKDAVRLSGRSSGGAGSAALPLIEIPLRITLDPALRPWLQERLARARAA